LGRPVGGVVVAVEDPWLREVVGRAVAALGPALAVYIGSRGVEAFGDEELYSEAFHIERAGQGTEVLVYTEALREAGAVLAWLWSPASGEKVYLVLRGEGPRHRA